MVLQKLHLRKGGRPQSYEPNLKIFESIMEFCISGFLKMISCYTNLARRAPAVAADAHSSEALDGRAKDPSESPRSLSLRWRLLPFQRRGW